MWDKVTFRLIRVNDGFASNAVGQSDLYHQLQACGLPELGLVAPDRCRHTDPKRGQFGAFRRVFFKPSCRSRTTYPIVGSLMAISFNAAIAQGPNCCSIPDRNILTAHYNSIAPLVIWIAYPRMITRIAPQASPRPRRSGRKRNPPLRALHPTQGCR